MPEDNPIKLARDTEYANEFFRIAKDLTASRVPAFLLDNAIRTWEEIGEHQKVDTRHVLDWINSCRTEPAGLFIAPLVIFPVNWNLILSRERTVPIVVW